MLRLTKELMLRHYPCSIEFVPAWQAFVVGTYELSEQADESINGRFGSLVLIASENVGGDGAKEDAREPTHANEDGRESADANEDDRKRVDASGQNATNSHVNEPNAEDRQTKSPDESPELVVALEQNCANGGVFDFRLLPSDLVRSSSSSDRSVRLYAAHSNGSLSTYEISKLDDGHFQVNELSSLRTGSSMLTCLDLIEIPGDSTGVLVIVGDSNSTLTLIRDGQIIRSLRIATFDYPVWAIKIRPLASDRFLLFTGSDDCVLRCFALGNEDQRQLFIVGEEEFAGGVTSIEIVDWDEEGDEGRSEGLSEGACKGLSERACKGLSERASQIASIDQSQGTSQIARRVGDETAASSTAANPGSRATGDEANTSNYSSFKVLVGSYDEKLRVFHFDDGDCSTVINDQKSTKRLQPARRVPIENAGIWKVKHHRQSHSQLYGQHHSQLHSQSYSQQHSQSHGQPHSQSNSQPNSQTNSQPNSQPNNQSHSQTKSHGDPHRSPSSFQLITGMYSGVHLMRDDKLIFSFNELPLIESGGKSEEREAGHLVYGCCFDGDLQRLLVTSFYQKTVYCLDSRKLGEMLLASGERTASH